MRELQITMPLAGGARRGTRWQAELVDGDRRQGLYFESAAFGSAESTTVPLRPFAMAALPLAMRRGLALRIPGVLDPGSYRNLIEWQQAMAAWHPGQMHVVPLLVEVGPRAVPAGAGAATAFSGGVDSCYTAVRYSQDDDYRRRLAQPLRAGIMVHGMDIPLDGSGAAQFEAAFARSRAILAALGLEALDVATNARELCEAERVDWSTAAHGILIASALACFEPRFSQMLIPSTFVYGHLRTPWGSHPLTDPLFSSEAVTYIHDGAHANKLDKVEAISSYSCVQEHLRVCWSGPRYDGNCGHCFKCVVTQACFWLAGINAPAAFGSPAVPAELASVPLVGEQNRYLFRYLLAAARERNRPDIVQELRRALRRPEKRWPKRYLRRKIKGVLRGNRN